MGAFAHNFHFKIGNEQPAARNQPLATSRSQPETSSKKTRNPSAEGPSPKGALARRDDGTERPSPSAAGAEGKKPTLLILLTG